MFRNFRKLAVTAALVAAPLFTHAALAAKPSAKQALQLAPVQDSVDYDQPTGEALEACVIEGQSDTRGSGWTVRDGQGRLLRRFLDTNKDNKVDLWCYFKNGVEVYRDIDADHNGKADQYRWMGTAGIRWGLDQDEDGHIDRWKMISAEEVTAEVIAALRERDDSRFHRLLLTETELKSLGLDEARTKQLSQRIKQAAEGFLSLAQKQKVVNKDTQWTHFGGSQPGLVPAGSDGSTKDVVVYDNVAAVVESGGQHTQIGIGTLIRVNDVWRVIDLPSHLFENEVASTGGFFFNNPLAQTPEVVGGTGGLDERVQKLIARLEEVDKRLLDAPPAQQPKANADRADIIELLIEATGDPEERAIWIRQYADTVGAATQSGVFPDGVKRLKGLQAKLVKANTDQDQLPYIEFRALTAEYALRMQEPSVDFVKVQQQWLENLADFVKRYPDTDDAAEAYLQLGMAYEFAGEEKDAIAAYGRIAQQFPNAMVAKKAVGAKRRLESVGKPLSLSGQTVDGKALKLDDLRGDVVLIHYWATWCEPCKNDLSTLKELQAKYARKRFSPIGISLDSNRSELDNYLRSNRLPWPQLFETGGLDSRLANDLGILSLPTMILIDQTGRVVRRNIHVSELDGELQKLLK